MRPAGTPSPNVAIYVGGSGALDFSQGAVAAPSCTTDGGAIGDLVLVPRGSRTDALEIAVVMRRDGGNPDACSADPTSKQCIIARRHVSFAEHDTRVLPIVLQDRCAGTPCTDRPGETCFFGECRTSDVGRADYCDTPTCDNAAPRDGGIDAADGGARDGAIARDGGVDGGDAGVPCEWTGGVDFAETPIAPVRNLVANTTTLFWSTGQQVVKLAKRGDPTVAAVVTLGQAALIGVDDSFLFYPAENALRRWDLVMRSEQLLNLMAYDGLAVGPTNVFAVGATRENFTKNPFARVSTLTNDRAPPTPYPQVAAANATHFFWVGAMAVGTTNVIRVAPNGTPAGMVDSANAQAVVADEKRVYTANPTTITVFPVDLISTPGTTFAQALGVEYLASSKDYLYWIAFPAGSPTSAVYRKLHNSPLAATPPFVTNLDSARGLVVDDNCVYYGATVGGKQRLFAKAH